MTIMPFAGPLGEIANMRDFPIEYFVGMVGKTIARIEYDSDCDEGIVLIFTDGSSFSIRFSANEGSMDYFD